MKEWTVVVPGPADSPLARLLAERYALTVLATPDIVDLPPDSLTASAVNEFPGPVAVAACYEPRAIYWAIRAAGVRGRRADTPATTTEGKAVHPVDIRGCDPETAAEKIVAITGRGADEGLVRDFHETTPNRWYPVIDYDRCTNCLQCMEFCLFGVYEVRGDGEAYVAIPDNCKTGCPACSRVCPNAAILFPRYPDGGPIAGAETGRPERLAGVAAREAGAKDVKTFIDRHGDIDNGAAPAPRLDAAIDDLEAFEL